MQIMERFVNVQVPLVDLDPDSAPPPGSAPSAQPTDSSSSTAASRTQSVPRTPRLHPRVSDDETTDSPPAVVPSISHPRTHRPPTPGPRPRGPTPAPSSQGPRARTQARMSVGPRPTHQLAPRDPLTVRFPHSTHEVGESSRHPDYRQDIGRITAEMRDARFSFSRLVGSHDRLVGHVGALEEGTRLWRQSSDSRTHSLTYAVQRNHGEFLRRTECLECMMVCVILVMLVTLFVAVLLYFLSRK